MKAKNITYWIATVLICAMMAMSAVMYLMHGSTVMEGFAHLGYPPYFPNLLGVAKLLGVVALLAPGYALVKEWAYAGFTFTFIAAAVSHAASHEANKVVGPIVALALLAASYFLRPASRKVSAAPSAISTV